MPKYAYDVVMETVLPHKRYDFWQKSIPDIPMNVDWMEVHNCNYIVLVLLRVSAYFILIFSPQYYCIEQFLVQD